MEKSGAQKNMRHLIEMFESRANAAGDADTADIAEVVREAYNFAMSKILLFI